MTEQPTPLQLATAQLRAAPPEPPAELVERVMRRVRTEARPGRLLTMPCAGGTAAVSEAALREALTRTLDATGAVLVARCGLQPAGSTDGDVEVELALHARWESFEAGTPQDVRQLVASTLLALFGLRCARVDIAVDDLVHDAQEGPR